MTLLKAASQFLLSIFCISGYCSEGQQVEQGPYAPLTPKDISDVRFQCNTENFQTMTGFIVKIQAREMKLSEKVNVVDNSKLRKYMEQLVYFADWNTAEVTHYSLEGSFTHKTVYYKHMLDHAYKIDVQNKEFSMKAEAFFRKNNQEQLKLINKKKPLFFIFRDTLSVQYQKPTLEIMWADTDGNHQSAFGDCLVDEVLN